MNSYEKEVIRSQLEAERRILFRLKVIYEQAARDISEKLEISNGKIEILLQDIENADEQTRYILQSQIYQRDFQKNLKLQLDKLLEDFNDRQFKTISEYLKDTYNNSFIGVLYNLNKSDIPVIIPIEPAMVVRAMSIDSKISKPLYKKLGEDVQYLKKRIANNISRGIATASPYRDIARNIASNSNTGFNNAMRIVRTESGRIYNAASLDSAKTANDKTGADLVKVWDSTLDSLTRPHHRQLDNQVRELDEDFEVDNLTASAPGHFGIAKEDINCRCVVLIKPRWDLEGSFTKRNNETGELLEFQDVQDYNDFKKKFWNVVDKSGENSIIEVRSDNVAEIIKLGKIDTQPLEKEFGKLLTDEIIITNERIEHIKSRHPEDYKLFEDYGLLTVKNPDVIIKDCKNKGTVFMVKKLPDTNLNVVARLVLDEDDPSHKNSIMTFYRIRNRNLVKLENKNKTLYKKE